MRLSSNLRGDHGTPSLWPTSQEQPFLHCFGFPNIVFSIVPQLFFYSFTVLLYQFLSFNLHPAGGKSGRLGGQTTRAARGVRTQVPNSLSMGLMCFQHWYLLNGLVHVHVLHCPLLSCLPLFAHNNNNVPGILFWRRPTMPFGCKSRLESAS